MTTTVDGILSSTSPKGGPRSAYAFCNGSHPKIRLTFIARRRQKRAPNHTAKFGNRGHPPMLVWCLRHPLALLVANNLQTAPLKKDTVCHQRKAAGRAPVLSNHMTLPRKLTTAQTRSSNNFVGNNYK
uniref:Uncharacterized protein n=1 Tax=Panagrellus redivivus TaxID=6233 RepID=A0A7E4V532_PANRE